MLTSKITRYLPLSMQFSVGHDSISKWISDLASEAQVLCIHGRDTGKLVGLIILAADLIEGVIPTVQLGYFLGEKDWGKGYATEIVKALIAAFENEPRMKLVAGVDRSNIASARVLEKSGFTKQHEQSTAGRNYFEFVKT